MHLSAISGPLKGLPRRWTALLCLLAVCLVILGAIALTGGRSSKFSAGVKLLAGQSAAVPPSVLLSATNQSSQDYAFSCWLEIQTESGWSDVSPSDDIRTLRYFRKGQVVELEVGLPPKEGVYRFHCFYDPLQGTTWSSRTYNRLMAFKLPARLGACYRQLLGRFQPWPRSFYSKVFEIKGNAQPARSSQQPPSHSSSEVGRDSLLSHVVVP